MPRGKGIYDDEGAEDPKPGQTDEDRDDDEVTEKDTPDVAESGGEPTG